MSGRWRIARREFAALRSEKTIVLAILIQLFIAGFSSFLLVGLVSMYSPGAATAGSVTFGVAGEAGDDLANSVRGEGSWELVDYPTEEAARTDFQNRQVDAVLLAETLPTDVVSVEALVPDESVRSTLVVVQLREALRIYERDRREAMSSRLTRQPLAMPRTGSGDLPDRSPTFSFTYTVLLPLLVFLPAFISGSVSADTITEELDRGTIDLLRVTPLSTAEIVDGKMLAAIALAPVQTAAWLGLLWLNGTAIANPLAILVYVAAFTTVLVAVGVGLALVFEQRQSAQLLYSLGVLALFLATSLLPESPPNTVAKLAIDSTSLATFGHVLGFVMIGVGAYVIVRQAAKRAIAS